MCSLTETDRRIRGAYYCLHHESISASLHGAVIPEDSLNIHLSLTRNSPVGETLMLLQKNAMKQVSGVRFHFTHVKRNGIKEHDNDDLG